MSIRTLEKAILEEARAVTGNNRLMLADIIEWRTETIEANEGETVFFLPEMKIFIAIPKTTEG